MADIAGIAKIKIAEAVAVCYAIFAVAVAGADEDSVGHTSDPVGARMQGMIVTLIEFEIPKSWVSDLVSVPTVSPTMGSMELLSNGSDSSTDPFDGFDGAGVGAVCSDPVRIWALLVQILFGRCWAVQIVPQEEISDSADGSIFVAAINAGYGVVVANVAYNADSGLFSPEWSEYGIRPNF